MFGRKKKSLELATKTLKTENSKYFKFKEQSKAVEQPKESAKGKGEAEEVGMPDYNAIDRLAVYDPTIEGATNIFVSTMLAAGFKIVHENEKRVKKLKNELQRLDFEQLLAEMLTDFYKYGTCYINIVKEGGKVKKLQKIPPHYMKRIVKGKKAYEYQAKEGKKIVIERNFIVAIDYKKLKDYPYPMSLFEPGLEIMEDTFRMNEQFRLLIEEYVAPILHTTVGAEGYEFRPSQKEIDKIAEDVEKAKRVGTDITTDKLVQLTYIQPDRGLAIQPYIDWFQRKVMLCTMIPESYLMYRSGAAAGGDSIRQVEAFHNWIRMCQKSFIEPVINKHLIPMIMGDKVYDDKGEKLEVDYSKYPKFEFNPVYEWKMRELNYELKQVNLVKTVNEVRMSLGMTPLEEEEIDKMMGTKKTVVARNPDEEQSIKINEGEKGE